MIITQKGRSTLKAYFVTDAIPTEQQFGELIDGMLNQKDDGLVKVPGNPLSLEAAGDAASVKSTLRLYESFADANPAWTLSLNPRVDSADPATARRGLSIGDVGGVSRLFVDHASGKVGVGTIEPQAEMDVNGTVRCTRLEITDQEEEWIVVTSFANGFSTQRTVQYCKDALGWVHLAGGLKRGSHTNGHMLAFTLPEGYRPKFHGTFRALGPNGSSNITLSTAGELKPSTMGGLAPNEAFKQISLDQIHFKAASVP